VKTVADRIGPPAGGASRGGAVRPSAAGGGREFLADGRTDAQAGFSRRTVYQVLVSGVCYYLATRTAWVLCFPESKVSLFFPPHAILVSVLLLVPTRHWWAFVLAAAGSHFIATQQENWPPLYALQCELFDAVKIALTAGGIRWLIKSPFHLISLREAVLFVLIAVIIVPFGTAFWGAAFTLANNFGTHYWVEWRNLGISNGVTTVVLVPAILTGAHRLLTWHSRAAPLRILEGCLLAVGVLAVGWLVFVRSPAGPDTSPALLYAPLPLLIWAALRFGVGGKSASVLAITILAIWGTMQGRGPFLTQTPQENALALQLFIMMAATPLLLLAVAIEDEKRSKQALSFSEERMSLAAQNAQLAIWDWDVVNDQVWIQDEGLFGFDSSVPIDHATLAGAVHPDDRAARSTAIRHALASGGTYEAEFRVVLADGSVRWVGARGRSLAAAVDGAPRRVLGIAMDITNQKQAATEAQVQREELAHLSRVSTLSALSSSLAHELSQPLSSILMNAETGQLCLAKASPDLAEIRAILAEIVSEDCRAGEIISRVRTMLRRGQVALVAVDLHEALEELLRLTRHDLIERGVSVVDLTTSGLPPAKTDRVQIQQVILNLIVNACDAMKSNRPEDRVLTFTAAVSQNEIRIGVLDRGVGLPEHVETLFEPFHSTKSGGLGMGLSIGRTLVGSHGGRLWAERLPGRGAAFYISLPLA
jgi:two-component system, LuxR family, sensor kinase FixL